eukprot:TRINITY_DN5827_c0_g1_i2.p1 TRINITY_DN5827_c0_g1~~TRINITY_DN5827_c0_g1_i2.p1  ORF type:complete len:336 (+),score=27.84 TRINITY_DN5827_c0_g1_i2:238-1245(+)
MLAGGGGCYSYDDCLERCPVGSTNMFCSSVMYQPTMRGEGLFDDHQAFGDANQAIVMYCTSDGHMGDREVFGRQFRGARVVQAVLNDLVTLGLGADGTKHTVILGGESAGARGAIAHLDYVPTMLGDRGHNVNVLGFFDSPLWLDEEPFNDHFCGFRQLCKDAVDTFAITHLDHDCYGEMPQGERWRCIMPEYRLRYVTTPYFLVASQYDTFQLRTNGIAYALKFEDEREYSSELAKRTLDVVKRLRAAWPRQGIQNAVFSWACFDHPYGNAATRSSKMTCGSSGYTIDAALKEFLGQVEPTYAGYSATDFEWIDECSGVACGSGCASANWLIYT